MLRNQEPSCHRCTKSIANKSVSCIDCGRCFHPGCVKTYLSFNTASDCCKRNMMLSLSQTDGPRISAGVPSVTVAAGVSGPHKSFSGVLEGSSCTLDSLFLSVEQLRQQLIDSDIRAEARAEARFSSFVEEQRVAMNSIIDKLNCINTIADNVTQLSLRLDSLERENDVLRREVDVLRSSSSQGGRESCEVIVSGLPVSPSISSLQQIKNVFDAIDASDMACRILDVRVLKRPDSDGSRPNLNASATCSYFVKLSSSSVCKMIIARKRKAKRDLKQNDVCQAGSNRPIYMRSSLKRLIVYYNGLSALRKINLINMCGAAMVGFVLGCLMGSL